MLRTQRILAAMSEMPDGGDIPEWTLGWRLQRALAHAGVSAEEMADEIGVSRTTVSRWMNDRGTPPRIGYVRLWAMRTGCSLEWVLGRVPVLTLAEQVRRAPISTPVPAVASVTRIHPELAA